MQLHSSLQRKRIEKINERQKMGQQFSSFILDKEIQETYFLYIIFQLPSLAQISSLEELEPELSPFSISCCFYLSTQFLLNLERARKLYCWKGLWEWQVSKNRLL